MRMSGNLAVTVIGGAFAVVVVGVVWFGTGSSAPMPADPTVAPRIGDEAASATVHVSGAVVRPGLVTVPNDARVADVIGAAGGLTSAADLAAVNLAAPVRDGERVVVPEYGDTTAVGSAGSVGAGGIDLNLADAATLEDLPGVGPVLAARIVAHRTEHGPFVVVEDLLDVPGIGEAKLEHMRPAIRHP